jgi:squalene synthase HpnD
MAEITAEGAATRASGSSFYAGMRILPRARREAVFEIYGFCRAVDDVADAGGPRDPRLTELVQWRADVNSLYAGQAPTRLRGLVEPIRRYDLRQEDFLAVIDGVEMDVAGDIRAPDLATLDLYCDRVASAVGRLCVRVFGMQADAGTALAHHLGRALQLTNILRDLDEDAASGRLYLPREALAAAGIGSNEPALVLMNPALGAACAQMSARAWNHFREADAIMERSPRRVTRAPRLMAQAYKQILTKLVERGWSAPRDRIRLSRPRMVWILLRHALF